MKLIITGAQGQLGREFIANLQEKGFDFIAFSKKELDVSNFVMVYQTIKAVKPDVIINCSAYNHVDLAEKERYLAHKVNSIGVYNLTIVASEVKAKLIHYSTDYVFDGTKQGFYTEEDDPNPLNEYAKSKLYGETLLQDFLDNYLIFRTSWVYGAGTQNFLYKLEQWAKDHEIIKIVVDEFSVPTSTRTIVEVTLKALDMGLNGLYHLTNSGFASRYEWAKEYFTLKGIKKLIYPALQADFNLPAKRPKWSVMSNEKLSKILGTDIPDWKGELKEFCKNSY
ncbi:dTDP-4-dehydrorhamnose reductase [Thermodesulfovibrio sp. N1]|uniref:dTDP-4-dehydrorhamnose reductase n=1 Tax=Thermodesulfovibrio sp. N1 TaxID=1871110 RepID=UPI00083A735C|nr:dTDP-4-dehydrorhamnose reductase [Thermodesulfovibrio sp. N1]ODA43932.1 dTDP-4-dehydrorhamnose reductase [Thermodesulfovibrio sp. N1]